MAQPPTPAVQLRPASKADLSWMSSMNQEAAPAVNALEPDELATLLDQAAQRIVVEQGGSPAGFVLALAGPGIDYSSENYRWFSRRFSSFLYVDRVVVGADARGSGLGGILYDELVARAEGEWPRICAEVNLEPPNPGSVRFHERRGFHPIGEQDTKGGSVRVVLMERTLSGPAYADGNA